MPLIKIENLGTARLALWRMSEDVGELPRPAGVDLSDIHAEVRLREKLTEYCLLRAMTSRDGIAIVHNHAGKPFIEGFHISISHTRGWAAMMLSEKNKVGVDIEYYSDRVNRIADRFIRSDEQNTDLHHRLVNWTAKEAVYKRFSEEDLQYFEMRLMPFEVAGKGKVMVEDLKLPKTATVDYILNKDYVLAYSF